MINNIVFDVGRVLLDYRWEEVLMAAGTSPDDASRITRDIFSNPNWHNAFDMGIMSQEELLNDFIEKYPDDEYAYRYFFLLHS